MMIMGRMISKKDTDGKGKKCAVRMPKVRHTENFTTAKFINFIPISAY